MKRRDGEDFIEDQAGVWQGDISQQCCAAEAFASGLSWFYYDVRSMDDADAPSNRDGVCR